MDDSNINSAADAGMAENGGVSGTIFDDVFRTIAQKMPFLLIPLINEVFKTNYTEDQKFEQLRNEHYEKFGKIVTDSIIRIGKHLYHIECQSGRDGSMVLRMVEYDFAIAIENSKMEDGVTEINFPESCVLYIRNHSGMPSQHTAKIRFAGGQIVTYKVPVIMAQDYTVDSIFEKRLLALLPYHILRYEYFLKSNSTNKEKTEKLLGDYQVICQKLSAMQEAEGKSGVYADLVDLIKQIADYVIPKENPARERIGEVMGGQILKLASERFIEEGRKEGREEGDLRRAQKTAFNMLKDGDSVDRVARLLELPVDTIRIWAKEANMLV